MKFYLLLIFFLFSNLSLFSQDSIGSKKNIIRIYPFQIALNREYVLSYERPVNKRNSLEIFASYYAAEYTSNGLGFFNAFLLYPANGFAIKLELKRFSKDNTIPFGVYHGPLIMYKYVEIKNYTYEESYYDWNGNEKKQVFAFEYLIGFQLPVSKKHFSMGGYFGLGFRNVINSIVTNYTTTYPHIEPEIRVYIPYQRTYHEESNWESFKFTAHLGFNIGYSF